jgi:UPF0716 protein FxsA
MIPALLLFFRIVPIVEVVRCIVVGARIGVGCMVGAVVATALIGAFLVSRQGRATLREARNDIYEGRVPARPLANGVMILIAGALLLTPGFLTDAIGFALLVPAVREVLRRWVMARFRPDQTISL